MIRRRMSRCMNCIKKRAQLIAEIREKELDLEIEEKRMQKSSPRNTALRFLGENESLIEKSAAFLQKLKERTVLYRSGHRFYGVLEGDVQVMRVYENKVAADETTLPKISASRLKRFLLCPRQFYYHYIEEREEKKNIFRRSWNGGSSCNCGVFS